MKQRNLIKFLKLLLISFKVIVFVLCYEKNCALNSVDRAE